jgi:hypothetical protein
LFDDPPPRTRVEIAEAPGTTDAALRGMSYDDALRWAADADGVLRSRPRLERVAALRRYDPAWIRRVINRDYREVLQAVNAWRQDRIEQKQWDRVLRQIDDD